MEPSASRAQRTRLQKVVIPPEAVDTQLLPIASATGSVVDDPAAIRLAYEERLAGYRARTAELEAEVEELTMLLHRARNELADRPIVRLVEPAPQPAALVTPFPAAAQPIHAHAPVAPTNVVAWPNSSPQGVGYGPMPVAAPQATPVELTVIAASAPVSSQLASLFSEPTVTLEPNRPAVQPLASPMPYGAMHHGAVAPVARPLPLPASPAPQASAPAPHKSAWASRRWSTLDRVTLSLSDLSSLGWLPATLNRLGRAFGRRYSGDIDAESMEALRPGHAGLHAVVGGVVFLGALAILFACAVALTQHVTRESTAAVDPPAQILAASQTTDLIGAAAAGKESPKP